MRYGEIYISNLMLKIFCLDTILSIIAVKNEIIVILERFLKAKILEKRLSIFAKDSQLINIDKNIALKWKNPHFSMYPAFGKNDL